MGLQPPLLQGHSQTSHSLTLVKKIKAPQTFNSNQTKMLFSKVLLALFTLVVSVMAIPAPVSGKLPLSHSKLTFFEHENLIKDISKQMAIMQREVQLMNFILLVSKE